MNAQKTLQKPAAKKGSYSSKITTDHETIKKWTEERGGIPSTVATTKKNGEVGIIRIKFPQAGENSKLQEISWDEFFKAFEEHKLAFLYQDRKKDGEMSTFFKLIRKK